MSRRGWALFTAVGVIWGIPYLLIKIADGGVSVPVLVFARVFTGSVLLLPIAIRGGQLRALRPCWKWVAVLAAVEAILPWLLLSAAERRLSSSLSGLLVAAVPVIGVGVARLAGDAEPLTALRWAGLAVGLGGVALLMGPGASGAGAWPVLEVLGTAVCYAIGPVIADRKLADADSLAVTAACLGLAAVVYAPAAALTWPHQMPPARVLSALAVLAVVCTALAFILYFRLISEVGAVRATVITYVNPAVAVALGAAVLGEPFTPVIAISFTLILAGSVLATRPAAHRGAGIPPRGSAEIARAGSKNLTEHRAAGARPRAQATVALQLGVAVARRATRQHLPKPFDQYGIEGHSRSSAGPGSRPMTIATRDQVTGGSVAREPGVPR